MNLLLTWASGEHFCKLPDVEIFLKSSKLVKADKLVVGHDLNEEAISLFEQYSFKILRVKNKLVNYVLRDRHFHFWQYLLDQEYEAVLHCDSRDVLFQTDPFKELDLNNKIYFIDEGVPSTSSGFHLIEQLEFQKNIPQSFKTNIRTPFVLNGGVTIGSFELMKNFHMWMWAGSLNSHSTTDQAALNFFFNYLKKDKTVNVAPDWFCLTGEAVKDGFSTPFYDNDFYSPNGKKYSIFHQWDRTIFAKEIYARFKF